MNIIQALEDCVLMWQWLADNPNMEKYDAVEQFPHMADYYFNCACCQYAGKNEEGIPNCKNCPIWDDENNCEDLNSPYDLWRVYMPYEHDLRKECAQEIANMARENLGLLKSIGYK